MRVIVVVVLCSGQCVSFCAFRRLCVCSTTRHREDHEIKKNRNSLTAGTPTMQSPLTASSYSKMLSSVSTAVDSIRMRGSEMCTNDKKKGLEKFEQNLGRSGRSNLNLGRHK